MVRVNPYSPDGSWNENTEYENGGVPGDTSNPSDHIYGNPGIDHTTQGDGDGKYRDPMYEALGFFNPTSIQQQFMQTPAFRSAYQTISSGPNPELWLPRLSAIVSQIVLKTNGIITEIFNDLVGSGEVAKLMQDGMTNLSNLMAEYNQWINSLPATQRKQFSDAGINIGLDGGSAITGSSMASGSTVSPTSLDAANQSFDNALAFVRDTTNGILNVIGLVKGTFFDAANLKFSKDKLALEKDTKLQDINLQRVQMGLEPLTSLSELKEDSSSLYFRNKHKAQSIEGLQLDVSSANQEEYNTAFFDSYTDVCKDMATLRVATDVINAYSANKQSELSLKEADYKNQVADSLDPTMGQKIQSAQYDYDYNRLQVERQSNNLKNVVQSYKAKVFSKWIQKAQNPANKVESAIYSNLLMNIGLNDYGTDSKLLMLLGDNLPTQDINDIISSDDPIRQIFRRITNDHGGGSTKF